MAQHEVEAIPTFVKTIPTATDVSHIYVLACTVYEGSRFSHFLAPRRTVKCANKLEEGKTYRGLILERYWWEDYPVFEPLMEV